MFSVASQQKIITLVLILCASLVASLFSKILGPEHMTLGPEHMTLGPEHMTLGDYPGVHYNKSNHVPQEVVETAGSKNIESKPDVPMKPSTYGDLSWGWSGFGPNIGTSSSTSRGSGSGK